MAKTIKKTGDEIAATSQSEIDIKLAEVFELDLRIAEAKADLDALKDARKPFEEYFDQLLSPGGSIKGKLGVVSKKVKNAYSILPEKVPALQKVFGEMFDDFVVEKRSYGLTAALRKIVNDVKHSKNKKVVDCVEVKATTELEFKKS